MPARGPDHPRQRASEHFLNLPRDADGLHSESCPGASACVVTAIKKDFDVLLSNNASEAQKLASLKFLGHWIGDIHQPLHVSFEDDRGGNSILVTGICGTNLHAASDTCLVVKAVGEDVGEAAIELLKSITPAKMESWTHSTPMDWANESFAIAEQAQTKYCIRQGASLAGIDSLASDDSDANCEALLEATDRLLWASARTHLELERLLGNRKRGASLRRMSADGADRDSSRSGLSPVRGPSAARDAAARPISASSSRSQGDRPRRLLPRRAARSRAPSYGNRASDGAGASPAISHAGSELSGPKVDGRRYAACLVNGASRTGLPRHARPLSQHMF
jgi:hypothetical protein